MSKMSKNQSILDLHRAQVPARSISVTLNIPVRTVYRIIKEGRVERKVSGPPPPNKKLNQKFLNKLAKAVDKPPTVSIRAHARKLRIAKSTDSRSLVSVPWFDLPPPYLQNDSRPSGWRCTRGCC